MPESRTVAVIGVGNDLRGDDGAGVLVIRNLADLSSDVALFEIPGDGTEILEAMSGLEEVLLIDAARSGDPPGTVREFDATRSPLPVRFFSYSTHAFGVAEAIEVARALERLPRSVKVWSIEGQSFDPGAGLSREVSLAVDQVADRIRRHIASRP